MVSAAINLNSPDLFGNDAAEDEDEAIFASYAVERRELQAFLDPDRRICIARALKGEGKSALLRSVEARLLNESEDQLIIRLVGRKISPASEAGDTDLLAGEWKRALFQVIAQELGSRGGFAWTDDSMSLVEEAERTGFKSKSLISAILDRVSMPSQFPERKHPTHPNDLEPLIRRALAGSVPIWIIVDDIDENFKIRLRRRRRLPHFSWRCERWQSQCPRFAFDSRLGPIRGHLFGLSSRRSLKSNSTALTCDGHTLNWLVCLPHVSAAM
jgi:hypothetical protein